MPYTGLSEFIADLERNGELHRINTFVDPVLEITEVTDRITKSGGKALLFENTGTAFPLFINAYGSDRRMAMAIGKNNIEEAASDIIRLFEMIPATAGPLLKKLSALPSIFRLASFLPVRSRKRGLCQKVIHKNPDLGILPVLKCWPFDGGRFITLPVVHTVHPATGSTNAGMYRMQIFDSRTTGMHWQRHKTGANHFEAWRTAGEKMPVSVTLGGDPVYTYCATAPLPENISEYLLAGFLRKKRVKLVKCLTNNLWVPDDADIVIEGYVDPAEPFAVEGPFGDHTGFYSLAEIYPGFHVTCITHSVKAVYPATIVGIPPQEDAWLAKATEKIFLPPVKLALQPEITDFHMPEAGVAHNLVIVKIRKSYPGQGMKVISSLLGAGQMMFTKYIVVISGDVDIRDYRKLLINIFENTDIKTDIQFSRGPLDVLDHSSDSFSVGGKAGIDATVKLPEETGDSHQSYTTVKSSPETDIFQWLNKPFVKGFNYSLLNEGIGILIVGLDQSEDPDAVSKLAVLLKAEKEASSFRLVTAVDHTVDLSDLFIVAWQVLGNSDPTRDHHIISPLTILIDGTVKYFRKGGFTRNWPNVVCSDQDTIRSVDEKWEKMEFEGFIPSPSLNHRKLMRNGNDKIF